WRNRFAFTRLCDGVMVNAKSIVSTLGKTPGFDTSICRVIYNGIEVPEQNPDVRASIRREFTIDADTFLIGCAGRLTPQKGFDRAIEAFAALAQNSPQARLIIAGDGQLLDRYKKQASAVGVEDKTIFAGYRNDMTDVLQALDLFWLTSRSEGMPNALLEAMACAKASVAFDVAGVPELLENGSEGFVVKQGDCAALAERTRYLMVHPEERRQMEAAALKKAGEKYGMQRMVEAVETYVAELIRK
ncbi:MAG: glycosyltransferase family 4 protein, partial [Chitinispirillaceae bacterium]|nr:glycosyltransferase family 4 protein [Chitinispirillaceae bacterium]